MRYLKVFPINSDSDKEWEVMGNAENVISFKEFSSAHKQDAAIEPSLAAAKQYIYAIDFSMIIDKLVTHHKWLRIEAEEACQQYRNYLWLLKKYESETPLPPSEDIDEFWHQHLLSSRQYIADCMAIWGRYNHHYPYLSIDGKANQQDLYRYFAKTQLLYRQEFGCNITAVRCKGLSKWLVSTLFFVETCLQTLFNKKRVASKKK